MLAYVCFIHFITFANMKLANIAKLATAGVGLSTLAMNSAAFAASGFTFNKTDVIDSTVKGTGETGLTTTIQSMVNYVIGFLGLVAVLYGIYGGFLYLTAAGNDEQIKKAKTIFKQVAIGILIVFLSYSVVTFFMGVIDSGASGVGGDKIQS